jgi:hypothetical protein
LGYCLDLLEAYSLALLKKAYNALHSAVANDGTKMPGNKKKPEDGDLLLRNLDCSVIQTAHYIVSVQNTVEMAAHTSTRLPSSVTELRRGTA